MSAREPNGVPSPADTSGAAVEPIAPTLTAALEEVLARFPQQRAHFHPGSCSYAELIGRAKDLAAALIDEGVRRGEPVGVLCPNDGDFLSALFGVLYAGAAAAPLPLPAGAAQAAAYPRRLAAIAEAAGMRTVLVSPRFASLLAGLEIPGVRMLPLDELCAQPDGASGELDTHTTKLPTIMPDDLAIVQFTSGSTSTPKGVRLTHGNVSAGLMAIREAIQLTSNDGGGGFWLPLFHDMGLFGTLSAIMVGIPAHVWSPTTFIKNPERWLREFAESGCSITAMPNFGYDVLVGAVEDPAELDLRHWRVAFNGAEQIRAESVQAFLNHFEPAGFAPSTLLSVYGMAEATLAVTFPPLGRAPRFEWVDRDKLAEARIAVRVEPGSPDSRAIASVGVPVPGMRVRIAPSVSSRRDSDDISALVAHSAPDAFETRDIADGEVGEILIQGPSVTAGYLGGAPTGEWLHTGDLGYLRGGELFVTGRCKEMIVVRGANFYPTDVEAAVREFAYKGRCAAVAADDHILLLVETDSPSDDLVAEITNRATAELGVTALSVHLVAPRAIPRTSSGKIQRLAARQLAAR